MIVIKVEHLVGLQSTFQNLLSIVPTIVISRSDIIYEV